MAAEQILLEEYESVKVCAEAYFNSENEVYDITAALVKKHPEIEALYLPWEGPAMMAMSALSDMNRTNIAVATGDLEEETAYILAQGGMIKAISAQCPYEQGEAIALVAANALLGKATPSYIGIEPVSVTPHNLLKTWRQVFKEEPPHKLKELLKESMFIL
jgi:ribose transport system substrate-binding protein